MKQRRQNAILQIIEEKCIRTQEDLSEALQKEGFEVTQATVSRDIKELRLLKKPTAGGSRYMSPRKEGYAESPGRAYSIFRSAVKRVDCAMHTIVMHTMSGMADAAAILQAIGNPDKYKLSAQGEFNADFACDGLTVDDAVRIQKKLAGITE